MRFDVIHCHGSGNDFPLIDARALTLGDDAWAIVARVLADRDGPVGGDGLLLLTEGDERAAFGMRMFNSDGSEAETCLNGLRCVARLGFELLGIDSATVRLKTSYAEASRDADLASGVYTVREVAGPVSLDVAHWPMQAGAARFLDAPIPPLPSARPFTAVAIPNPHLVSFVEVAVDEGELVELGQACEAAPAWLPNRANVSFVEQRDATSLYVRTFERGVGLTDSCGSAMAASAYAACLTERAPVDADLTIFNRGGLVRARVSSDAMVSLSGNATWEWTGRVDLDIGSGSVADLAIDERHAADIAAWRQVAG